MTASAPASHPVGSPSYHATMIRDCLEDIEAWPEDRALVSQRCDTIRASLEAIRDAFRIPEVDTERMTD